MTTLTDADDRITHRVFDAYIRTDYNTRVVEQSVVPSSRDTRALWRFRDDLVVVLVGDWSLQMVG